MSDNKTLQLEELKQLLTQLENIEQELRNDSIDDKEQKAELDEVGQLIQTVREDIEEVHQLVKAQGNKLKPEEIEEKLMVLDSKITPLEKTMKGLPQSCTSPENTVRISSNLNEVKALLKEIIFLENQQEETTYGVEYNKLLERFNNCNKVFNEFIEANPTIQSKHLEIIDKQKQDQATEKLLVEISSDINLLSTEINGYEKQKELFENKEILLVNAGHISDKIANLNQIIDEKNQPLYTEYITITEKLNTLKEIINAAKLTNQSIENIPWEDVEIKLTSISKDIKLLEKEVYAYKAKQSLFEHKETLSTKIEAIKKRLNELNPILTTTNEPFILEHQNHNQSLQSLKKEVDNAQEIIPATIRELHNEIDSLLQKTEELLSSAKDTKKDSTEVKDYLPQINSKLSNFNKEISKHLEDDIIFNACENLYAQSNQRYETLASEYKKLQSDLSIIAQNKAKLDGEMQKLLNSHNNDFAVLAKHLRKRLEKVDEAYLKFIETVSPSK